MICPILGLRKPIRYDLPHDVAPGQSVTINVSVGAPGEIGNYVLRQRMVKEYVGWFEQLQRLMSKSGCYKLLMHLIFLLCGIQVHSHVPSHSTKPGNETWNVTGPNLVKLGAYFDAPNDLPYTWLQNQCVLLCLVISIWRKCDRQCDSDLALTVGPNNFVFD